MDDRDARPARPSGLSKRYLARKFFRPERPVSWLNPLQLAGTGVQVFLSERFGAYLDKRELQGIFPQPTFAHSTGGGGGGVWFDFVADTGDGFNATYAVARLVARDSLPVKGQPLLPRGEFLVMGGDQVYPTPSSLAYESRLRGPGRAARPEPGPVGSSEPDPAWPRVYALPGNHDWYDGLTAFLRVFAGAESRNGRWVSEQQRSYFAVKLPGNWWLFAIDAQRGAHLDDPQLTFFHTLIRDEVADGARIIMCVPEPGWVQSKNVADAYESIDYFLGRVVSEGGQKVWLGRHGGGEPKQLTVPLMVSGDWHHYSRYESVDREGATRQLITAGGGGAYLYGTHRLPMRGTTPVARAHASPGTPWPTRTAASRPSWTTSTGSASPTTSCCCSPPTTASRRPTPTSGVTGTTRCVLRACPSGTSVLASSTWVRRWRGDRAAAGVLLLVREDRPGGRGAAGLGGRRGRRPGEALLPDLRAGAPAVDRGPPGPGVVVAAAPAPVRRRPRPPRRSRAATAPARPGTGRAYRAATGRRPRPATPGARAGRQGGG